MKRSNLRILRIALVSWIAGMAVFWAGVTLVYGTVLDLDDLLLLARVTVLALGASYALVHLPLFRLVESHWQGSPALALSILGGLLAIVPFLLVVLFSAGFNLGYLDSFSLGEAVPSLLLFGAAGVVFGWLYGRG